MEKMENHVSLKVRFDIKKALKIKSAKEVLNLRDLIDKIIKERRFEEYDLSNG